MKIIYIILFISFHSCFGQTSPNLKEKLDMEYLIDNKDSLKIQKVKFIPELTFDRIDLKYLSVCGQDCDIAGIECFAIKEVPPAIKRLKNLKELHLTLNYIETLPIEILQLNNLKVLDLSENPSFSDISIVEKIKWLKEFYCFGCNISKQDLDILRKELPDCKVIVD